MSDVTLLTPRIRSVLDLRFHYQPDQRQTALEIVAQTPPLRVVRAFHLPDGSALAHLHNISGGVLGGDAFALHVSVGENARAQLTTPGATRIYRHRVHLPDASQQTRVEIESGAVLEYLPDPLIPFADSRYRQSTHIQLAPDAGLFWWETIAPGREAYGERFGYELVEMTLEIATPTRPIALERYQLCPRENALTSLARLGSYLYHTTFYICRVGVADAVWLALEAELTLIARQYSEAGQSLWGVSTLTSDGLVVRGLSMSHRQLPAQLIHFWRLAKQKLYGSEIVIPRKNY
jgi:urease accessory protein